MFLIDNLPTEKAEALDPETPGEDDVSVLRRAPDGKMYRVWKVLWRPEELRRVLLEHGIPSDLHVEDYRESLRTLREAW